MKKIKSLVFLVLTLAICFTVSAQKKKVIDISKITTTVNRNINMAESTQMRVLHVNENSGTGLIKLKHRDFKSGEIEFEVRGKDVYQKSFVGFAFHLQNDTTYEAIYFRPFNFKAEDELRKKHAVQYISLPNNDWPKLRSSFPLKYEQPIGQGINPDEWFKVRIKVEAQLISVYVNGNEKPCLEVVPLGNLNSGKIAFWVGEGSGGDFKNLTISEN